VDGRYFIFESNDQIWALRENGGFLRPKAKPIQLTSSPMPLFFPLPSKDGKKLFVVGQTYRGELVRYDSRSGQFLPALGGISAEDIAYSSDGQHVAYVSYPEGALWRMKLDGSERMRLTYPPTRAVLPRWSPDGRKVVFHETIPEKPDRILEVAVDGATPQLLMPDDASQQSDPNWSPDGTEILFSGVMHDAASTVRVLDLSSRQLSTLPGSQGMCCPRWSPSSGYIIAKSKEASTLMLFHPQAQNRTALVTGTILWASWSKDGQYVYFLDGKDHTVQRIRVTDRKTEKVVDLKGFHATGWYGRFWLGLAPDDSPLLLREAGTQDVYALDWEAP